MNVPTLAEAAAKYVSAEQRVRIYELDLVTDPTSDYSARMLTQYRQEMSIWKYELFKAMEADIADPLIMTI